jgi:hypothetical protein
MPVVTAVTGASAAPVAAGTGNRWVRVGHSWDADARTAGVAAARSALDTPEPKLLIVFASLEYDLPELLAGVRSVSGDVPLIGCSTSGEIGPVVAPSSSVVVACLGGAFDVSTCSATGLQEHTRAVGEQVVRGLLPLPDTKHRVVLMLTDALAGDQQEMIRGAYGLLGATVPMVGGGAGDSFGTLTSRQLHNGQILQDSVIAAVIGSDGPIGLAVRHGWHHHGDPMVVTASQGNQVLTLDDRPALDLYLDRHDAPDGIARDPAAFAEFGLTRPLAVARRGDVAVRHVIGADIDARSIICAAPVPKGAAAWLASGDAHSLLNAADTACAEAVEQLGSVPVAGLLVFDCGGRRPVLGEAGTIAEQETMVKRAAGGAFAGFYSCGEIARTKGVHGFHNQTIVALALS